jgi:hypothetical protein
MTVVFGVCICKLERQTDTGNSSLPRGFSFFNELNQQQKKRNAFTTNFISFSLLSYFDVESKLLRHLTHRDSNR